MRRIFLLSLGALLCAAGICTAVVWLLAPESRSAAFSDAETVLPVLRGGVLTETTLGEQLIGVTAAEMPADFEPEALKAQAVAARSYILDRNAHRPEAHPEAAVCDDPGCCCAFVSAETMRENWGKDWRKNLRRIESAVRETDGEVMVYEGAPIRAVFHSASAGKTESSAALWGAVPYLVSVESPETAADVPGYETTVTLSPGEVRRALEAQGLAPSLPDDPAAWLGDVKTDASGRVETIVIGGQTLSGAEARACFSLRSAAFTAEYADGAFVFHVTGSGHGVGMSQYGANVLAKQGDSYAEILEHYYPGAELKQRGA